MPDTTERTTGTCPQCGAGIRADERFTAWCAACDWNVDPARPEERPGRRERTQRALARRHGERLHAEVTSGRPLRPRRDASAVLAQVIALAVHGTTAVLVVAGVWLLLVGLGGAGMVLGPVLLVLAWVLRPRFPGLSAKGPVLRRADAPELYALVDEIAAVVGTRGVDAIAIDPDVNASVTTYGVRGRRLLTLGLPLWETLTPQQRIAILGHELGHYAHGDIRHGHVVATAYWSLTTWHYMLAPIARPSLAEMAANLFGLVPRLLVRGLLTLLDHLTLRATQRAEYLADAAAARAGSTEAAVGFMDRLLVGDSLVTALRREAGTARTGRRDAGRGEAARADGLWARLAEHAETIPEHEYERRRRAGALRGHAVDSTHPPTHLRRACLLHGEPLPPAVTADDGRERRIAAELADARGMLARELVRYGVRG
ncbi:M48 family metallopeptidase [Streptomyces sp. NPDC021100]|uniref:M48 family metallopeptidase n=1 Tax=Streptomyces sp. NPDC021100 TaxID=3365114 RepID=UPI0037B5E7F0